MIFLYGVGVDTHKGLRQNVCLPENTWKGAPIILGGNSDLPRSCQFPPYISVIMSMLYKHKNIICLIAT